MWAFASSRMVKILAPVLVVGLVIGYVYLQGVNNQKEKDLTNDLIEYKETRKRIDDVAPPPDRTDAIERLRELGIITE